MRIHCLLSPSCTGSRRSISMSSPFDLGWRITNRDLPALATQQPLGGCWVVGGQHDQARLLLLQREDLAGALGEQMPVSDARELAAPEDIRPVGEVPGQQQRRPGRAADQQ